jgi:hypothetical protein
MTLRKTGLAAALVLSLALAGCGSKDDNKADSTATTRAAKATTTTTAPSAQAAALEAKLIKTPLAGYKQEADDVGDTGPSDLDKAVRDDGNDDARAELTKDGFVAGYQRYWTKGDNELIDFLYQFSNATGAANYTKRTTDSATETDEGTTITEFAVTGIPGGKGYLAHSSDGDSALVVFTRGVYSAQVVLNGTDATQANAQSLAKQQYDNLA